MTNTVVGIYDDFDQAKSVVEDLKRNGFAVENVRANTEVRTENPGQNVSEEGRHGNAGMMDFFRSLFTSSGGDGERRAGAYAEAVRRGGHLVTVHAQEGKQSERAIEIMNRYHPIDIDERAAQWQSEAVRRDADSAIASSGGNEIERERNASGPQAFDDSRLRNPQADNVERETRIPVVQEELQLGKRTVQRGGVRIFQHVTESPVEQSIRLREERVSIERQPVNRPASEADAAAFKEASFEIRETVEEPVVSKSARVVEQIVVAREVSERTETVKDIVRRTDVEMEKLDGEQRVTAPAARSASDDTDFRRHWQSTYGNRDGSRYEDFAPAYRYGSQLGGDERYGKHRWSEVEPEVQHDWETSHHNRPWERVKEAVRYGWEKVAH